LERVGGDKDLFMELLDLFLETYPERMQALRTALDSKDFAGASRAAHDLKGSIGNFGAREAYDAAIRLENLTRDASFEDAESIYQTLQSSLLEFDREAESLKLNPPF